jgi:hypothetical protein
MMRFVAKLDNMYNAFTNAQFIEVVKETYSRFSGDTAIQEIWSELRRRVLLHDENTLVQNLAWRILKNAEYHVTGQKVYNRVDESFYI